MSVMKDFEEFSEIDFASNDEFIDWVKKGSKDLWWKDWITNNPDKKATVEEAKKLVLAVVESKAVIDHDLVKSTVWSKITESVEGEKQISLNSRKSRNRTWLSVAASIAVIFALAILLSRLDDGDPVETSPRIAKVHTNKTSENKTYLFPDGSSVILYPNSSIQLLPAFGKEERAVNLNGKGFFEVVKDPNIQFVVVTEHLTTRVLGTSFLVSSYDGENHSVAVNTGKVSVYGPSDAANPTFTLEKSEKVEYNTETNKLMKVDAGESLETEEYKADFEFSSTPLQEVFLRISEAYGINIDTVDANIGKCSLNASLTGIPLEDKIRLICKASNLEYEMNESTIRLIGQGCD